MNTISKITSWGDSHHLGWFDFFRILLGGFLFYKGIEFGRNPHDIGELTRSGDLGLFSFFLVQYIPMIHLMGGFLIALGFKTRWAVLFQIPVLLGAVVLHLSTSQPFELYPNLVFSITSTILLFAFLIYGSGPYSVDEYFRKHED